MQSPGSLPTTSAASVASTVDVLKDEERDTFLPLRHENGGHGGVGAIPAGFSSAASVAKSLALSEISDASSGRSRVTALRPQAEDAAAAAAAASTAVPERRLQHPAQARRNSSSSSAASSADLSLPSGSLFSPSAMAGELQPQPQGRIQLHSGTETIGNEAGALTTAKMISPAAQGRPREPKLPQRRSPIGPIEEDEHASSRSTASADYDESPSFNLTESSPSPPRRPGPALPPGQAPLLPVISFPTVPAARATGAAVVLDPAPAPVAPSASATAGVSGQGVSLLQFNALTRSGSPGGTAAAEMHDEGEKDGNGVEGSPAPVHYARAPSVLERTDDSRADSLPSDAAVSATIISIKSGGANGILPAVAAYIAPKPHAREGRLALEERNATRSFRSNVDDDDAEIDRRKASDMLRLYEARKREEARGALKEQEEEDASLLSALGGHYQDGARRTGTSRRGSLSSTASSDGRGARAAVAAADGQEDGLLNATGRSRRVSLNSTTALPIEAAAAGRSSSRKQHQVGGNALSISQRILNSSTSLASSAVFLNQSFASSAAASLRPPQQQPQRGPVVGHADDNEDNSADVSAWLHNVTGVSGMMQNKSFSTGSTGSSFLGDEREKETEEEREYRRLIAELRAQQNGSSTQTSATTTAAPQLPSSASSLSLPFQPSDASREILLARQRIKRAAASAAARQLSAAALASPSSPSLASSGDLAGSSNGDRDFVAAAVQTSPLSKEVIRTDGGSDEKLASPLRSPAQASMSGEEKARAAPLLSPAEVREELRRIREQVERALGVTFPRKGGNAAASASPSSSAALSASPRRKTRYVGLEDSGQPLLSSFLLSASSKHEAMTSMKGSGAASPFALPGTLPRQRHTANRSTLSPSRDGKSTSGTGHGLASIGPLYCRLQLSEEALGKLMNEVADKRASSTSHASSLNTTAILE